MNKAIIATFLTLMTALSGVTYLTMNNTQASAEPTANDVYNAWVNWLSAYKKQYTHEEIPLKYATFSDNYKYVQNFNQQKKSFKVGLNQFADLTNNEFASLRRGQLIFNNKPKNIVEITGAIPTSINWADKGAVTPIKNQGQCGSCWSFSTTGSLEGLNFITNGKLLSFSEQQLVDCSQSYGNQGCNGGLMDDAFEYVAAQGIELESTYPYTAEDGTCQYKKANVVFQNKGHSDVTANSPADLKKAVAQQPVSVAIEADQQSFQLYSSGIYDDAGCGTQLDHGVLAVGYGVSGGKQYWIVKNSWGASWGNNGYIWIQEATGAGICGINMEPSYPTM